MLLAVNIGWPRSGMVVLSKRRSMRRLPLASFRPMILFTRNPSLLRVVKFVATLQTPEKREGFEFFQKFIQANASEFAYSRPSWINCLCQPRHLAPCSRGQAHV